MLVVTSGAGGAGVLWEWEWELCQATVFKNFTFSITYVVHDNLPTSYAYVLRIHALKIVSLH